MRTSNTHSIYINIYLPPYLYIEKPATDILTIHINKTTESSYTNKI